jgi:acyl-CoA thioester hydrolase
VPEPRPLGDNRFVYSSRVRYSELDPQQVVFYSRYLEYVDAAITAYWRDRGIVVPSGYCDPDLQVKAVQIEYRRPLRYEETYDIGVCVNSIGRTSVTFDVTVYGNEGRDVRCVVAIVYVNVALTTGKPVPITDDIRGILLCDVAG